MPVGITNYEVEGRALLDPVYYSFGGIDTVGWLLACADKHWLCFGRLHDSATCSRNRLQSPVATSAAIIVVAADVVGVPLVAVAGSTPHTAAVGLALAAQWLQTAVAVHIAAGRIAFDRTGAATAVARTVAVVRRTACAG